MEKCTYSGNSNSNTVNIVVNLDEETTREFQLSHFFFLVCCVVFPLRHYVFSQACQTRIPPLL